MYSRDVRVLDIGRSHADPGEVRTQVVPAMSTRHFPRRRGFERQQQSFMAGVEIDTTYVRDGDPREGFHELDGFPDRLDDRLVFRRLR